MPNLEHAWSLYLMGRYAQAEQVIFDVLRREPQSAQAYAYLALLYGRQLRIRDAHESAEQAIRLAPSWDYSYLTKAWVDYWSGNLPKAKLHVEEAIKLDPLRAENHRLLSCIYGDQGKFDYALLAVKRGVEADPCDASCLCQQGACFFNLGNKAAAEICFRQALEIDSDHADSHYFLGHQRLEEGGYQEALRHYQTTLRQNPDWHEAQEGWREALRGHNWFYRQTCKLLHWFGNTWSGKAFWIGYMVFLIPGLAVASALQTSGHTLLLTLLIFSFILYSAAIGFFIALAVTKQVMQGILLQRYDNAEQQEVKRLQRREILACFIITPLAMCLPAYLFWTEIISSTKYAMFLFMAIMLVLIIVYRCFVPEPPRE